MALKKKLQKRYSESFDLIGFEITGQSLLNLWGGGQGTMDMEEYFIPVKHFTKDNMLRCVNDNGMGCESIESADILVLPVYKGATSNRKQYGNSREFTASRIHNDRFLGWSHLRKIGAIS